MNNGQRSGTPALIGINAVDNSTLQSSAGVGSVKDLGITDAKVAAANKDGASGTPSMRTLGTGAAQACAGNDSRLSDSRTPTAHKTSHENGGSDEISVAGLSGLLADVQDPKINGQTAETSAADADEIPIYDASEGANNKMTRANFLTEPSFHAYLSADQLNVATGTNTKINLNAEDYDTNGFFDNATNYRFQPTIAGKYLISFGATITSIADTKTLQAMLFKNGAIEKSGAFFANGAAAAIMSSGNHIVSFNGSTDYVELYVLHTHGANRDVFGNIGYTYMAGVRVSP